MESHIIAALISTTPITNFDHVTTVTMDTYCINGAGLTSMLAEYQESPMLTAVSARLVRDKEVPLSLVLYANPTKKTWTLVEKVREDFYCVIGMGDNIKPYTK